MQILYHTQPYFGTINKERFSLHLPIGTRQIQARSDLAWIYASNGTIEAAVDPHYLLSNFYMAVAKDKQIGTVTHWYDKIGVAVIKLTSALKKGDTITVKRGDGEFEEVVSSLQIDHKDVDAAKKGDDAAIKLGNKAKEGAKIFLKK